MRTASALILACILRSTLLYAQTEPATQPEDEKFTVVKRGDISTVVEIEGHFEPTESFEVRIRPEQYQGELKILGVVEPGTVLKKGAKLLEIDQTEIKKQLAAAENDLASAQANLAKAEADVAIGDAGDALAMRMQQTELSNAEAGLKWWEDVDGAHMLKGAELATKAARDNVEDQTDELDQLKKMYKSEELTSATADIVVKRAIRALERAKVGQQMQEARESKVRSHDYTVARQKMVFAVEQQKQQLAELTAKHQQQSATRKTALVSAQQALEKAQTKVDELKADVEALTVAAPFDGVAYAGDFNLGEMQNANLKALRTDEKIAPNQVVMTLVPAQKLRLVLETPESKLQHLKPQLQMRVTPMSAPDAACEGVCEDIAAVAVTRDRTQFFPVRVNLSSVDQRLAPTQRATARIDIEANKVLVVPTSAISSGRIKIAGADEKGQWRHVITGASDGEMIEIRSGVNEGEKIFTKATEK